MDQGTTHKKRKLVKKFQSPVKSKEVGSQLNFRSSNALVKKHLDESNKKAELVQKDLSESCKKKSMQNKALETHKRKQPMPSMHASQGQKNLNSMHANKQPTQKEGKNIQLMEKVVTQSTRSSRNQDNSNDKEEVSLPAKVNRTRNVIELDAPIEEQRGFEKVKKKSAKLAMSIDEFLAKQGIHVEDEGQPIPQPIVEGAGSMPSPNARENNRMLEDDGLDEEDELGIFDRDVDQVMETSRVEDTSNKRKTRGKTTCKHIHSRTLEERVEVTFDNGQAIGPTAQIVNDLTHFLGTLGRNQDFISLMYTNWRAVPEETIKKRLWTYACSKFIIPKEGKKWVMDGIREAWKRHKTYIKKNHFDIYDREQDMLRNRPPNIPEVQFKKLIAYWSLPSVKSMCDANSENRKQQKWRHRMGPINFGRVRVGLRESSDNKEEPTQSDVFVATRTGRKGKELDSETQVVVMEIKDRQNSGEAPEDAFQAVFGKERPGRVRCFGRTVTKSSLKKNKEINKLKEQHAMEKESWEIKLKETNDKMQGLEDLMCVLLQQSNPNLNIEEALAAVRAKQSSPPNGNGTRDPIGLSSTSTHIPNHD